MASPTQPIFNRGSQVICIRLTYDADSNSARTKYQVLQRYKGTCVICGRAPSVHHIYENATEKRAESWELVVLCATHNTDIELARRESTPYLPPDLSPSKLLTEARDAYWRGEYARGYGQTRIAAYFFEKHEDYSQALECLTEAISDARPLRWGDWLAETIKVLRRIQAV